MACLVHTDISKIDLNILRNSKYGASPQDRAINYLIKNLNKENIWLPAYNYDFGKTKIFNPKTDPTSVGAINIKMLTFPQSIRTYVPIFSHVGFGTRLTPKVENAYKPFSKNSDMQNLLDSDSDVVFFGASLNAFTFLHYIEEQNQIGYRYSKVIYGKLNIDGNFYDTSVEFKVRPFGKKLEYDWGKIEAVLKEKGIIKTMKKLEGNIKAINMHEAFEFLTKKINQDQYYLLKYETKKWVKNLIERNGRPLAQEDFENINT